MSKYIKQDSIIGLAHKMRFDHILTEREVEAVEMVVNSVSNDAVVDLVSCLECKYADKYCHCSRVAWWTDEYDFCSKGKLKGSVEDETDN